MPPPRLITIPISHFCEKARWALERAGIEYVEERHLQGVHHFYALAAGGGLTTPVLKLPGGRAIGQSAAIVRWCDEQLPPERRLYPPELDARVSAVEHWLDTTLGSDGRAWVYGQILPHPDLVERFGLTGVPQREARFFKVMVTGMKPYIAARVRLQGSDPDIRAVYGVFDEIADRLGDGRRYLTGDRFTAADLAFAALSASVLAPSRYGVELPQPADMPAEMRAVVEDLRAHPAGQFALRIFAEERPTPAWLREREAARPAAAQPAASA